MTKQISILTTFFEAESGYSLIGVCETQIRMLLDHGYEPIVLVQENFTSPPSPTLWSSEMIDLRPVLPALDLQEGVAKDFDERVERIRLAMEESLADADVCIAHDLVLQSWFKEHNAALREYAKTRPDLLWLHWLHSCPTASDTTRYPEVLRHIPPPGYLAYPNASDRGRVCTAYHLNGQEWRLKVTRSAHAIDPLGIWHYDDLTRSLAVKSDLLSGDVVAVYPVRLDRGKQPEKIIYLMAGVKSAGYEPRLLIVDWQSGGGHFQNYIDQLLALAKQLGIEDCVNFSSRLDDRANQGVPRHVVAELMDLSNVYIHPSAVETYSLVVHEAALRGLLLVLNYDFPAMFENFGDNAIYMDFGSDRVPRTYDPDEKTFFADEAKRLIAEVKSNQALMARTTARREWSPTAQWREFEVLLYLTPVGE